MNSLTSWCLSVAATLCIAGGVAALGRPSLDYRLVELEPLSFPGNSEIPLYNSFHRTDLAANRLVFPQREVRIAVEFGPPGWPFDSLVIAGLNRPELELRSGARLSILLLNLSPISPIMLGITSNGPPFAHQPILPNPWERSFRQRTPGQSGWSHAVIPRGDGRTVYAARIVYEVGGAGTAYYVNDAEDAANAGEYGKITIVP
jgi:hypothetical protein